MNMQAFPLAATVATIEAQTGLFAATVDSGYGEPAIYPGYLTRVDALRAGAVFAIAIGRRPIMPADSEPAEPRRTRDGRDVSACFARAAKRARKARDKRKGLARREQRRVVMAAKHSFIDAALDD